MNIIVTTTFYSLCLYFSTAAYKIVISLVVISDKDADSYF